MRCAIAVMLKVCAMCRVICVLALRDEWTAGNCQRRTWPVSSPTAVIKGAQHPNAAKLFAQFMISPEAQKMIAEGGIHAARIDIAPPPGQSALSEVKLIPVDLDLIEARGRELKARFAEIFQ